tara:strand:- start:2695 stop:3054 length:360 start_codon:yes stop_codon:yes gene_type:complete
MNFTDLRIGPGASSREKDADTRDFDEYSTRALLENNPSRGTNPIGIRNKQGEGVPLPKPKTPRRKPPARMKLSKKLKNFARNSLGGKRKRKRKTRRKSRKRKTRRKRKIRRKRKTRRKR